MANKLSSKTIWNDDRLRAKGMFRFIFVVGFIRFALPVTILNQIIRYIIKCGFTSANIGVLFTESYIVDFLIEMFAAGITFGLVMWVWGKKEDYPKLNQ